MAECALGLERSRLPHAPIVVHVPEFRISITDFRLCEGFRMPAHHECRHMPRAGVRKPPGKERAGRLALEGVAGSMVIWASGMACAGAPRRWRTGIEDAGEDERRAVVSSGPVGWW